MLLGRYRANAVAALNLCVVMFCSGPVLMYILEARRHVQSFLLTVYGAEGS